MEGFRIEIEKLRKERSDAVRLFASSKISEKDYNIFAEDIERKENHYTNELERLSLSITEAGMVSVQKIFELAINAKSLWKSLNTEDKVAYLKKVCSNPVLDELIIQYDLKKPFARVALNKGK